MDLRKLALDDVVSRFDRADAMPASVTRLCRMVGDTGVEVDDVVSVVERDQSLTAQLLRRANSAALGGLSPVSTVRHAVLRLGPASVVSLALGAAVSGLLRGSQPAYLLAPGELWRRSVAASVAGDLVRQAASGSLPVETATAALLHDFGKVVLGRTLPPEHLAELRRINLEFEEKSEDGAWTGLHDELLMASERDLLGFDHAEVGARIMETWRLPAPMCSAVAHHHETRRDRSPMSMAVSVAHAMVPDLCGDPASTSAVVESHGALLWTLGIDPDSYPQLRISGIRMFLDVARGLDDAA